MPSNFPCKEYELKTKTDLQSQVEILKIAKLRQLYMET